MKTLYRQFIVATLFILALSILIGFTLANVFYLSVTKEDTIEQNIGIAEEVTATLNMVPHSDNNFDHYLEAVANLGYQIAVVDSNGRKKFYGKAFEDTTLPEKAQRAISDGERYTGLDDFSNQIFMIAHFTNKLHNTVGVPFTYDDERYGLFIRPDTKLLATDIHSVLIGFVGAIGVVSILGMVWMARQLTRPIVQLTEATQYIARENYSYPLEIKRNDEIGQLSESFNLMQIQLQHNDLARKSFISNVSHDFQSPLMNIQGYADLLKSPDLPDSDRLAYTSIIDQEAKRLSSLTRQLLLLTSLDQGAYPMKTAEFRLDESLKSVVRKYRWRLEEEDIDISYKLSPAVFRGDPELLENVWDNLLTNAIKYNKPGGSIEIGLSASGGGVAVMFKDSGIGIAEDAIPQLFDRFYRVDAARKTDGTGLGLSIVQQIVSLHQGEIRVDSQVGTGSEFTITFPVPEAIR
ncbi:HAMP domain-containing sensor histidine kinase [Planococcus shenhongbingii]|uniref:sensor histidine kinase n=1 Tax=Planococcus shenhongbingii TaxID=3058398 RepID=UPI00261DFDE5|nr:HAMP domain-containing sensor histidine kinase [Planococcus sp. N016]WKA59233.1 HAMP domain-containing sensor histidine kinase [Planococcus sp. N016]